MAFRKERRVRWVDPVTGRERCKVLPTGPKAQQFLEDRIREQELIRDGYIEPAQVEVASERGGLIANVLKTYNSDREHRRVSTTEITSSTALIEFVLGRCRFVRVADINAARLKTVIQKLAKDRQWSARTVNRYSECLRGFLRSLGLDQAAGVLDTVDAGRDRRRISRALTVSESDALVNAAIDPLRRLLYVLRLRTGLRVREASRLDWSDIDTDGGMVRLRPEITKNGKAGEIPIASDLADEIEDYRRHALKAGIALVGPVFASTPDVRTWKRDLVRAGIAWKLRGEQADPKALRKTYESLLLRSGADINMTMLLMRHTPRGGLGLTLGVYADDSEIAKRKRHAVNTMTTWIVEQRRAEVTATG